MVSLMHARGVRHEERGSSTLVHSGSSARRGTGLWLAHARVHVVPCVATRSTDDLDRRFVTLFLLSARRQGLLAEQQRQPRMGGSSAAHMAKAGS
jgi:hypothetical protein